MRVKIKAIKILSFLCIGLLAAAVLLWLYSPTAANELDAVEVYEITNIPVGEVSSIAITNDKMSFGVLQQGGALEILSDVEGRYDASQLRTLIYAACHLTGSKIITDPDSWESYGYSSPRAMVSLFKSDGTAVTLAVLMQNPISGGYYVFSQNEQAIFLISKSEAELFLREERDFFSHTVFPSITASNYTGVESVALDYNGNGRDYIIERQGSTFFLTSPIKQRIPATTVLQELLSYITALYSDEFVADGTDLSKYGFDDYTLKISLSFEGNQYTTLLLDRGGDSCLMANPTSGTVYQVSDSNLSLLLRDYLTLLGGKAYQYSAGDLRNVAVMSGDEEVLFEISGEGDAIAATSGDVRLDAVGVSELMKAINGAQIEQEVPPAEIVSGTPSLSIVFTVKSGSVEMVEFIPTAGNTYYIRINGVTNFTTTKATLDQIRDAVITK